MSRSGRLLLLLTLGLTQLGFAEKPGNATNGTRAGAGRTMLNVSSVKAQRNGQIETGTLRLDGEYRFANGMVVGAGRLYETVRITAERVDPTALPYIDPLKVVSDYIRLKATGVTQSGDMRVTIPYPANLDPKTLLIGTYTPKSLIIHPNPNLPEFVLNYYNDVEVDEIKKTLTINPYHLPENPGAIFFVAQGRKKK
jgi:hypothetical protein